MYTLAFGFRRFRKSAPIFSAPVPPSASAVTTWPEVASVGKTEEELKAGQASAPARPLARKMTVEIVNAGLKRASFFRQQQGPARFKPGDRVRTLNVHPSGHTRLPRYARGKTGTVERIHGCHAYPDAVASGKGDDPQWLYTVVFDGREVWGPDADPTLTVSIDAFEPYLEPV